MKPVLVLIILADGAAAFCGGVLASRLRTRDERRPAIAKLLMIILLGYAGARFWQAWNTAQHAREVIECFAAQSPDYLWHSYGALTLQALMFWTATIYLVFLVMNGRSGRLTTTLKRWIAARKKPDSW